MEDPTPTPPTPEPPPPEPTPAERVRNSRADVDAALDALAAGRTETAAAEERVNSLRADMEAAASRRAALAEQDRSRTEAVHRAVDASIEALQAVKAAHPLPSEG